MAAGADDDRVFAETVAASSGSAPVASSSEAATAGEDEALLGPVDPSAYVRGETLATGGMGRIVAARDRRLGRRVAIKEVRAGIPELRRRFAREVRITARLQHPNIITVHEAGTWPDGEPFFAMKLVAGRSLDKVVAERTTLEARLALLPSVIAVADALAYAHRERVIDRDLKPANVLVGDFGETVVIDWGLAKDLSASEAAEDDPDAAGPYRERAANGETAFGAVIGTPAYMPPEQARGEQVDERADVYALGALAYHVLCGRAPVDGASVEDVLAHVIAKPLTSPRARDPRIPLELDTIIGKAMAHEPGDRYPSAVELAEDLKRFQTGQLVGAHHYTSWQLARRWVRRRRTPLAVAAIALVVLLVGGGIAVANIIRERDRASSSAAAAIARKDDADRAARALLVEGARREVLDRHPLRALAMLREAMRSGESSDDVRYLLGVAMPFADTVVFRSGHEVIDARFSADEQHVLTASRDGHVRVLDAADGALVHDIDVHDAEHDLELGPSDQLATLVERRPDMLKPFASVVRLATLAKPDRDRRVSTIAYDERGTRVWRIGPFITVDGVDHSAMAVIHWSPPAVAVRAHGADLLLVTDGELIRLRDEGDKIAEVSRTPYAFPEPRGAAISADLARVALASDGRIAVLDGSGAVANDTSDNEASPRVAISDDGTQLADISRRNTIELISLAPHEGLQDPDVDLPTTTELLGAQFSADGSRILATDSDANIFVIDVKRGAVVTMLSGEIGMFTTSISRDGSRVVAALRDGTTALWDVARAPPPAAVVSSVTCAAYAADDRLVTFGPAGARVEGMADPIGDGDYSGDCPLDPGGHRLVRVASGKLEIVDLARPAVAERTISFDGSPERVAIAPDGKRVAVRGRDRAIAVFIDGARAATWTAPALGALDASDTFAFSPDGAHFIETSADSHQIFLFDSATGAAIALATPELRAVRWSADGATFVSASGNGTVTVWDAHDGHARATLLQPAGVLDLAMSADGISLLTAGDDGVVRHWDMTTQAIRAKHAVSREPVVRVVMSPSAGLFATVSKAGEIALWSMTTGDRLRDLATAHEVTSVAFNHDGTRLLAVDRGHVLQWNTRLDPRTAEQIAPAIERAVPWRVDDGRLVPRALPR